MSAPEAMEVDTPETDFTTCLPISRIKKILKVDPEHMGSNEAAVHAMAFATEQFIKTITSAAATRARISKRKKIQYGDVSQVVEDSHNLWFLHDAVPRKFTVRNLTKSGKINTAPTSGQATLNLNNGLKIDKTVEDDGVVSDEEEFEEDSPEDLAEQAAIQKLAGPLVKDPEMEIESEHESEHEDEDQTKRHNEILMG